jgi:hypothetical protein
MLVTVGVEMVEMAPEIMDNQMALLPRKHNTLFLAGIG